jgi:hypothetical protein
MLLQRAANQYHYLARTNNKDLPVGWYTSGVAEHLGWHHWDGTRLELGVLPLLSLENRADEARRTCAGKDFDLVAYVEGKAPSVPGVDWAMVHYLATGDDGKPFRKFFDFAHKLDNGANATPMLWRTFSQPPAFADEFRAWLSGHQQPWVPLYTGWDPESATQMRATSDGYSACRLAAAGNELQFTLRPETDRGWRAGALVHWTSNEDWAFCMIDSAGGMHIARVEGGRVKTIEQGAGPPPDKSGFYRFQVFRKKDKVFVMFPGGLSYGPWDLPSAVLGVAIHRGPMRFADVVWK